jgi:hypothetical protein
MTIPCLLQTINKLEGINLEFNRQQIALSLVQTVAENKKN